MSRHHLPYRSSSNVDSYVPYTPSPSYRTGTAGGAPQQTYDATNNASRDDKTSVWTTQNPFSGSATSIPPQRVAADQYQYPYDRQAQSAYGRNGSRPSTPTGDSLRRGMTRLKEELRRRSPSPSGTLSTLRSVFSTPSRDQRSAAANVPRPPSQFWNGGKLEQHLGPIEGSTPTSHPRIQSDDGRPGNPPGRGIRYWA